MDSSRHKRREIRSRRQSTTNLGSTDNVPRASSGRPELAALATKPVAPLHRRLVTDIASRRLPKIEATTAEKPALPVRIESPLDKMPLDMELPGGFSHPKSDHRLLSVKRTSKARRRVFRGLAITTALVIGVGGLLVSQGYIKIHRAFKGSAASVAALTTDVNPNLLKTEGDSRINILLLGRGGGVHDAPDLTDTMLLASIDPISHNATLLSIPRDLWVSVPNQGAMKINAVWETGEFRYLGKVAPGSTNPAAIQAGFKAIDQVVTAIFGVPINYNLIVDFQAFKQAVDTVGGVTVNVPTDLYDPTMAWENHDNSILAKAGIQTFNGPQALIYVRSRETTSDFARSQRQRTVMLALKSKVDTLGTLSNPIKLAGLINAFGNNVATDLSLSDATRLYGIFKDIPDTSITSVGLADPPNHFITTGPMNDQSIDLPTAGLFDYGAIQAFVRTQLKDGYIVRENAKVLILNGTGTSGLATAKADELKTYGYNVVATAHAPSSDWTKTMVVDLTRDRAKYTKHYLEQRFGVLATNTLPDLSIQTNGADFVIIIGSDVTTTPKI